jgi:hypothetical protein
MILRFLCNSKPLLSVRRHKGVVVVEGEGAGLRDAPCYC